MKINKKLEKLKKKSLFKFDKNKKLGKKNNPSRFRLPNKKPSVGFQFFNNLISTFLIFLIILTIYSFVSNRESNIKETTMSDLVENIKAGEVKTIKIEGDKLNITLTNGLKKITKKESDSSLSETLSNYGVTPEQLKTVNIDVGRPSGFGFWLATLAPFLIPLLFIAFLIWFMTRQVKGAGMQAFSFGQSKARFIDPEDKKQRITFKDVAGVKEAKQELLEIVDFLKNPKKFLDIGAEIPKGLILMGAPGTGKCVVGNTTVVTNKGLLPIEEIPKYFNLNKNNKIDGAVLNTIDLNTVKQNKNDASHWFDLGIQKTIKIKSQLGISIEGTPEHPIVILNKKTGNLEFSRIDNISKGDILVVSYNHQSFGNYTIIPDIETAYIMGLLVGDGGLSIKNKMFFSSADHELVNVFKKYFWNRYKYKLKKTSGKYDYAIHSKEIREDFRRYGLDDSYAIGKKIPSWINLAPKEYIIEFIRGLFDTDGYCGLKTSEIEYSSASENLVHQVSSLLFNVGIVNRFYSRNKIYNNKKQFYLKISGDFIENFAEEINFSLDRKKALLNKILDKDRNTNNNLIFYQSQRINKLWSLLRKEIQVYKDIEINVYKNINRYIKNQRQPSKNAIKNFLYICKKYVKDIEKIPEYQFLFELSKNNIFFSPVTSLGKSKNRVFDFTVPKNHSFIANNLISHNTLLAKAVAGEAGVPFFSISGSEFVEMFVGVGASRVRDLFKLAKQSSPSIIFVDEIDAVGRVRGTGVGGGNDEREQTLNQILVEMDGFEPNEKVIVIAATNRPDVLDPALLRTGRFDRRVVVDLPDRKDREEILAIHSRKKPFAEDVNLKVIAERTPGFSGADLYSLMNEGAILAAREGRKKVSQFDLIRSVEKVMLGPERKSHILSKKEKKITAYHEAGHALVSSVLKHSDPVHKISIISRGRAAGYTLKLPLVENKLHNSKEFLDDIAMTLGGYAAEKIIFGDITTGPSNDLQMATAMARNMVTKYGMSDEIGPVALADQDGKIMFGAIDLSNKEYSERTAYLIDMEVTRIVRESLSRATQVLNEKKQALENITKRLIEVETIERKEFEDILIANGITPKKLEK